MNTLTEGERQQILYDWNETRVPYPDVCVHELFEQQAARSPDAVAVVFRDESLTYRELNERANQVAHHLRKRGVGPETLVGVSLDRSPEMVVALLGVWKAGGAYVPLDPAYPQERLSFMVGDANVHALLTDDNSRPLFPSAADKAVCLDSDWPKLSQESSANPATLASPSNIAYVMYTSGSTGRPKGAIILHSGLVNYLCWAIKAYGVEAGGSVPVHSSVSFDLTVTSLYPALLAGGCVELLPEDVGAQNLLAALREGKNRSLVKITPAHLELLSQQLTPEEAAGMTKTFVIGGENLLAESLRLWRESAPSTRLINEYGPTETVVGCCVYEVRPEDPHTGSVPIGRPIANTQLYILDPELSAVAAGVTGELYVGGAGVARGYLNRPELTQERFLADPFSGRPGARLYKTGDLARYREDGTLEYQGRVDDQVKVRGYRIELGEIEATLAGHPGVKSCAVLAREDTPGNKQLVGYVVPQVPGSPAVEDLRQALKDKLPDHMVPAHFVFLESLPLTPNGKVDRKGLPAPSYESAAAVQEGAAPRNDTEKALLAIWRELLQVENVGVDDDFFSLGGHSLLAIKAVSRIRDVFDVDLGTQAVFDNPTIAGLAKSLADVTGAGASDELRMEPLFFGEPPLFAVYHPARARSVEAAVLVCPSIGHEHTRSYRAVQILCQSAARAGLAAMRFDYTGVGDSAGDFASAGVDAWCDDVLRAAEKLRALSGAREVHLVGLRLGAALALAALQRAASRKRRPAKSLLLWDPLFSGPEFLDAAGAFQALFLKDPHRFDEPTLRIRAADGPGGADDYLFGYSFPEALRRSLQDLDLRQAEAWPPLAIRVALSEPSAAWADLAARLKSAGRTVTSDLVKGTEGAWANYSLGEKTLRAGPVISHVVEQLAGKRP